MARYDVRETRLSDIRSVALGIRDADREELFASSRLLPFDAIMASYMVSRDTCMTGTYDDRAVCIFGVKTPSLLSDIAVPWMLATKELNFHSREFLRRSRDMVSVLSREFPYMENYVDERNVNAVRWLQWVGFNVYYPEPFGPDNLMFHRFDMVRD